MIPVQSEHTPVLVCVPSATMTRYVTFEMSVNGLHVPAESFIFRMMSGSPAANRNTAVRRADRKVTHFWFVDDDHWFDESILLKLLDHRVPVVAALCCVARPPWTPVVYKGERTLPNGRKQIENYTWRELDAMRGLVPVFAVGGSGLLVERSVMDKIGDPWFELGKRDPEEMGEDLYFADKLREAGVPICVDVDAAIGHFAPAAAWPVRDENGLFSVTLVWENGEQFRLGRGDVRTSPAMPPAAVRQAAEASRRQ